MIEQFEYWLQWPPQHELLAGFTGYKPPLPAGEAGGSVHEIALVRSFPTVSFDNLPPHIQEWLWEERPTAPTDVN